MLQDRLAWLAAVVVVGAVLLYQEHGRTQEQGQVQDFMRLKLEHAQRVLEGVTLEDFELIAKHSQEISLLSQAASWRVLQTPEYLQQSMEFRRVADALTAEAKERNLDGAALKYVDLTLKCVNCHKYVRGVRVAQIAP